MSVQRYVPAMMYLSPRSRTWATTGNTDTVTDADVTSTTGVVIIHTVVPVGFWKVVTNPGSGFTVTSSDSESTGLTYKYKLI